MRFMIVVLCAISVSFLAGCQDSGSGSSGRYTGEKDSAGNFLVLDTGTGKVEVLQNDQLVEVPKEKDIVQVKEYPAKIIPGMPIEIGELRLKFRDGKLIYQGYVKPMAFQSSQPSEGGRGVVEAPSVLFDRMEALWEGASLYNTRYITFQLFDADGFNVTTFEITRDRMTRIVDKKSQPVRLSFEASQPISIKDFEAIKGYNFHWKLAEWEETTLKE